MAYATVDEVVKGMGTVDDLTKERIGDLLDDAKVLIDARFPPPKPMTDEALAARRVVSKNMVRRAVRIEPDAIGATTVQQMAGPYQEMRTFSSPAGDMYLTKVDRRILGAGQSVHFVKMAGDDDCR